jgi:hypothetical protein
MFARFRNGLYSVLCTMNNIAVRTETYLEGLPNVGIVIDDQNVRLTHFATFLYPGELEEDFYTIFRHSQGALHCRKVVSGSIPIRQRKPMRLDDLVANRYMISSTKLFPERSVSSVLRSA